MAGGYLYLIDGGTPKLVAPLQGEEPPSAAEARLRRAIDDASKDLTVEALGARNERRETGDEDYFVVLLRAPRDGRQEILGGTVLGGGGCAAHPPEPALVAEIAGYLSGLDAHA